MIFDIVMGILLIKKKTTKMAYILAITELVYIVLVLVLGGTIGIGAIAFLLALAGAIRIDKKWKQYQEISGGSNQLNHTGNSTARTTHIQKFTHPKLLIMEAPGSRRKKIMILYQLTALKVWRKH